jgi:tetratricopeptide (TPR) repeat protein
VALEAAATDDLSENLVMLAMTLQNSGQPELAVEVLREGHERRPADFWLAYGLARACKFAGPGHEEDAVRYYCVARALKPTSALVHFGLGHALRDKGKMTEAAAAFQEATRLKPDWIEAQVSLGDALRSLGRFRESLSAFRQAHQLMAQDPDYSNALPLSELRDAERLVELDGKLPALLAGAARPADAAEQIELAYLCYWKRLYASSARFYADAFASRPPLADDLEHSHRYNAACSAALAGCGRGEQAGRVDEDSRAPARRQALGWLNDDLAAYARRLDGGKSEDRALVDNWIRHWRKDADLAGVRDADALGQLPEAERADWQKLWQDVDALRKRAAGPK